MLKPLLLLSLVSLATLASCSGSGRPEFTAAGAHISESSDAGTVVAINIKTFNRSEDPLPLTLVEYSVELDGKPAVTAARSAQATAHQFSEQVFSLPAVVAGNVRPTSYRIVGTVTYVPANLIKHVLYDEGIIRPSESFSFEGPVEPMPAPVPSRRVPELTGAAPRPATPPAEPKKADPIPPVHTGPRQDDSKPQGAPPSVPK